MCVEYIHIYTYIVLSALCGFYQPGHVCARSSIHIFCDDMSPIG